MQHMLSSLTFVNLICSWQVVAVKDVQNFIDGAGAGEEAEDMQASVALLQANISRLRSGHLQVEQESVYHLHIPKVAGTSLSRLAAVVVRDSGRTFSSSEGCFDHSNDRDLVISMVREPHRHIQSMFRYCLGKEEFKNQEHYDSHSGQALRYVEAIQGTELITDAFEDWLRAWAEMLDAGTAHGYFPVSGTRPVGTYPSGLQLNCYAPVNLQAHRFQCEDPDVWPDQLSADVPIHNMHSLWVLGLQEEYEASACLLYARAHGALLAGCSCDSRAQLKLPRTNANDGNAQHLYSVASPVVSDEARELLDRLTSLDRHLYEAAVVRFHEDVAAVEAEFGVTILCTDNAD